MGDAIEDPLSLDSSKENDDYMSHFKEPSWLIHHLPFLGTLACQKYLGVVVEQVATNHYQQNDQEHENVDLTVSLRHHLKYFY